MAVAPLFIEGWQTPGRDAVDDGSVLAPALVWFPRRVAHCRTARPIPVVKFEQDLRLINITRVTFISKTLAGIAEMK